MSLQIYFQYLKVNIESTYITFYLYPTFNFHFQLSHHLSYPLLYSFKFFRVLNIFRTELTIYQM